MEVSESRRLASIGGYAFAEVNRLVEELTEQGVEPIDFGVGDPTMPTPEVVRTACRDAVETRARSGYPSYIGAPEFREECAGWMRRRFGVELDPAAEISSTAGSKEAVFHLHEGLVDPGDVVLGPNPGYPPYARGTLFAEGRHVPYPLLPAKGFLPDLAAIPDDVAERAKLLWICYPNSPTGALAPLSFLEEATRWCRERDIVLASDEAYSEIYFTEEPPRSALECGTEGVIAIFSLSKRSAMTGYRVGWVAGDERLISIFRKLKTNIVRSFREEYREKRDLMVRAFCDIGLPDCTPDAALYLWQRVPDAMSSVEFARRLLDPEIAVVVTPGTWLSFEEEGADPGEGYVRLALVPSLEDCGRAADRIRKLRRTSDSER